MKNPKLISIIIVSYNTSDLTQQCIKSVYKQVKGVNFEIIVIDNSSSDNSREMLQKISSQNSNFILIQSKKNLGFSKANNKGIKKAKGDYILLLNSDTKLNSNLLKEMLVEMEGNGDVGISSCALKNSDGSLQVNGGYFPNLLRVAVWMTVQDLPLMDKIVKPFHPKIAQTKRDELDWVSGAFFLLKREVINNIGLLDEDYFMYTEEVDFCFRANSFGWKVLYLPKWSVTHYGGASGTKEFSVLSEYKGVKTFFSKHYHKWQFIPLRLLLKAGAFWRMFVLGIIEGKGAFITYAKAFIKA